MNLQNIITNKKILVNKRKYGLQRSNFGFDHAIYL